MDYIKGLPLAPHCCRSAPHQLPLVTAVCTQLTFQEKKSLLSLLKSIKEEGKR